MAFPDEFAEITQYRHSLAPFIHLRIGGPAEYLVTPRNRQELARVLIACQKEKLPFRVLGVGTNLIVRDEGIAGVVIRLIAPEFTQIAVDGNRVIAGGGASVSTVIAEAATHQLAGLETLVGIVATLGGACAVMPATEAVKLPIMFAESKFWTNRERFKSAIAPMYILAIRPATLKTRWCCL